MRKGFQSVLVLSVLLVSALPSFGQTFGQISGTVTDTSGAILVGALGHGHQYANQRRARRPDEQLGELCVPHPAPWCLQRQGRPSGVSIKVINTVELQVQQTARLDFSLELGNVEVAVEVTGSAPMINATDATVGTVIENRQILELPLNGRNFINLVSLSPERELGLGRRGWGRGIRTAGG